MNMQKVELPVNIPVAVVLASLDGVPARSNYPGSSQMRFTAADGRALFVPSWIGDQVISLGSRSIRLCKTQDAQHKTAWHVDKWETGEQRDGTFVIPKEKPGSTPSQVTEPGTSLSEQTNRSTDIIAKPETARKRHLWDAGRELIDGHAALMQYATEKHPGVLTSYDVRTYLVTAFINASGGRR